MTPRQRIVETIVLPIAKKHGVDVSDIFSRSWDRRVVAARDEAACCVKDHIGGLSATARIFRRDHSAIFMAIGRHHARTGVRSKYSAGYHRMLKRRRDAFAAKPKKHVPTRDEIAAVLQRFGLSWSDFSRDLRHDNFASRRAIRHAAIRAVCVELFESKIEPTARALGRDGKTVLRAMGRA